MASFYLQFCFLHDPPVGVWCQLAQLEVLARLVVNADLLVHDRQLVCSPFLQPKPFVIYADPDA